MSEQTYGTVIWCDGEEGFGIIQPDDGNQKVSIDFRQIHHDNEAGILLLQVGHRVAYTLRGSKASNLFIIAKSA